MEKIDFAIVGGGIIGLTIAHELLLKYPQKTIVLFEKEKYLGEHSSGRNSCVLHAGIYYSTGSLKHRLCLEGLSLWKEKAVNLNIPLQETGKFIVARNNDDLEALEKNFHQAKLNSVTGIRRANKDEVTALKEKLHCVAALYSPHTGIVDGATAINQLKNKVESLGGIILPYNGILDVEKNKNGFLLTTVTDKVWTENLINSAGLGAVTFRKKLGLTDLEDYWVKGHYVSTSQKNEFRTLIYPVPAKDLKGLGVHLTFDFADQIKFGPDTEEVSELSYLVPDSIVAKMTPSISSLFKTIDLSKLRPDYAGIRPKIKRNGQLHTDFWIESPLPQYVECCGIESPGFTSSWAIARSILTRFF